MSENKVKCLNVMHHTHWDREWYESYEEFRYKLRNGLRYIQNLIEDKTIKCFFVDGQTIVIDDYKEIVSDHEFLNLKKLIKDGKIEIGPWYILSDEFLVGGESIIKNLELGIDIAKDLGSKYNIGYLPDTFGHISQMPQILKGYGIENAIIWRGAVSNSFENQWIGSDGSKVLTFVLPLFDGYFQTYMKHDDWKIKLTDYINKNKPYCNNGQILSMNGADHTYTSENIQDRLNEFKKENLNIDVEEVLMSDFVKKFESFIPKEKIIGEQRNQKKIFVLPGVFSTRMYLKQANQRCEDEIINILEFLNTWTDGKTNSDEFIKYLWKLLIQNHAHDSICGCSIDEVHDEMETRFKKITAAISQFEKSTLEELYPYDYLANEFINNKLYLINNVPFKDKYVVTQDIIVPKDLDKGDIKLKYKGEDIKFEILKRYEDEVLFRDIKVEPYYSLVYIYKVRFVFEFDGIESKVIDISLCEKNQNENSNKIIKSNDEIENDYYKIKVNKRGLTIIDKINNKTYDNQHIFLSSLDAGDTYTYSPPLEDVFTEGKLVNIEECLSNDCSKKLVLSSVLNVPKGLNKDRTTKDIELIDLNIKTTITLIDGSDKILFESKINNKAKNHKLRIGFNLRECNEHYSDTAFDLVKRGVLRKQIIDVGQREELECNQHPTLSTIVAEDFQIIHRGMQEYEVTEYDNNDYCFITALRCVGDLSRRDLRTRGGGAGPSYETKKAQCEGEYTFNYGLIIGKEKFNINNKNIIRNNVLVKQSKINKAENSLLSIDNNEIAYSSLIRKKDGTLDLRLFNHTNDSKEVNIKSNINYKKIIKRTFDGKILEELRCNNYKISVLIKPKEICTISFI